MAIVKSLLLLICLLVPLFPSRQVSSPDKSGMDAPPLPVIDYNACPFEDCMFRKWVVAHDSDIFSSWKEDRKLTSNLKKGDVVFRRKLNYPKQALVRTAQLKPVVSA
jgi:hypothetical protein